MEGNHALCYYVRVAVVLMFALFFLLVICQRDLEIRHCPFRQLLASQRPLLDRRLTKGAAPIGEGAQLLLVELEGKLLAFPEVVEESGPDCRLSSPLADSYGHSANTLSLCDPGSDRPLVHSPNLRETGN